MPVKLWAATLMTLATSTTSRTTELWKRPARRGVRFPWTVRATMRTDYSRQSPPSVGRHSPADLTESQLWPHSLCPPLIQLATATPEYKQAGFVQVETAFLAKLPQATVFCCFHCPELSKVFSEVRLKVGVRVLLNCYCSGGFYVVLLF